MPVPALAAEKARRYGPAMPNSQDAESLVAAADVLRGVLRPLKFSLPVTHVYDPLDYAWASHTAYLRQFGMGRKKGIFLGMNPGPYGMAQTGVPFGEVEAVRGWMGIEAPVQRPPHEHPKRPVEGFACRRSEVSGRRLWGWAAQRFGTAEKFFEDFFVVNYCPLIFLEESGRNRTPDKVPASEMAPVEAACDAHLKRVIEVLEPEWLIGVGGFAENRLEIVAGGRPGVKIMRILHPSPASPAANRDWAGNVDRSLVKAGVI
ncbi:MAG: Uracil glycosylase superfamily [Verrucomicrobiales bacterium]|nr:Uracil glycosylase superfamily [Verrucomicrobiales bacterium]